MYIVFDVLKLFYIQRMKTQQRVHFLLKREEKYQYLKIITVTSKKM